MALDAYKPYSPCCFSLSNWQEKTVLDSEDVGHHRLRDVSTGEVYRGTMTLSTPKEAGSERRIRGVFTAVAFGSLPLFNLVRIPMRIHSLFCGDFAAQATAQAKKEYDAEWIEWSKGDRTTPCPTEQSFKDKEWSYTWQNLAIEIGKIILYPFASVALMFIAFYGAIVDPADAGKWFATIELFLSQGPYNENKDRFAYCLSNILMGCRQPISVTSAYRIYNEYSKQSYTLRGLLNQIDNELREYAPFLHEIQVQTLRDNLNTYRKDKLPAVSKHDTEEFRWSKDVRTWIRAQSKDQVAHADVLSTLLENLKTVRTNWQVHIEALKKQAALPAERRESAPNYAYGHRDTVQAIETFTLCAFREPAPKPAPAPRVISADTDIERSADGANRNKTNKK